MNRIRELRKQNKMTQKELAAHLQIADSTLSYWEMGKYEPNHEALKKLSEFFHVSIDYLLCGDISDRETGSGKVPYTKTDNRLLPDGAAFVSETQTEYISPDAIRDINIVPATFLRAEFEGLTQEEIDKLAEYARFLKTLRTD